MPFSKKHNEINKLPEKNCTHTYLPIEEPNMKIVEVAASIDPDEMARNELSHLELHSMPSSP